MRKIIFLISLVSAVSVFAQSAAEEAIILNQELQFLEDSVNNVAAAPATNATAEASSTVGENKTSESLEETYFQDEERDTIRTRSAAPKRRSF